MRVSPYGSLHLTAVDTTKTRKVDEHRLVLSLGSSHTLLIIGKTGLYNLGVEVKVLRVDGRRKGTHSLTWGSPQTRYHINGKGQRHQATHDTDHRHRFMQVATYFVALELQPTTQICTQQTEDNNPQGEKHLAIQQMPAIGQVGYGEELQGKCQFYETQYHLDGIHP